MPRLAGIALLLLAPQLGWGQTPAKKPLPPAEAKAALLKLLDRPKVPFDGKWEKSEEKQTESEAAIVTARGTFASERRADGSVERVPFIMVRRFGTWDKPAPKPVVIVLHGTGGNKESMRPWLEDIAKMGFTGIAIDARYHGERVPGVKGSAAYVGAITKAWRTPAGQPQEHPLYYDTVWDLWRLLDYLETRPDVDKTRIGMIGDSFHTPIVESGFPGKNDG